MVRTTKHADCSSTDQGGGKRRADISAVFHAVGNVSQWGHYFRA